MASVSGPDPASVCQPRTYEVEVLKRDLQALCDVRRAASPAKERPLYLVARWRNLDVQRQESSPNG